MNVLYIVFRVLLGGHVISAFTIAKGMRSKGINPIFAGGNGDMVESIKNVMPWEEVDIPLYHGDRQTYFTWNSFAAIAQIRKIVKNHKVDMIHAFDSRSYIHAYVSGMLENIPVLCTLCGGQDPYYNLPISSDLIVFSEEQKSRMVNVYNWPTDNVKVIRTRIDTREILNEQFTYNDFLRMHIGFSEKIKRITLISSFDSSKVKSILIILESVEKLFSEGHHFQLIFIGGKGDFYNVVKSKSEKICRNYGKYRIIFLGQIPRAYRLLKFSDIVIGSGRSAFEGMFFQKPTIVVGVNGFAGIVSPDNIEEISWYNFSGRNKTISAHPDELNSAIISLLNNENLCKKYGLFGKDFVTNEIDITAGIERISSVYNNVLSSKDNISIIFKLSSLFFCLLPVIRDNLWHSIKRFSMK